MLNADVLTSFGFNGKTNRAVSIRQRIGPVGISVAQEKGAVLPALRGETESSYRLTNVTVDKPFNEGVFSLSVTRIQEKYSILGGRLGSMFGEPKSSTIFLDAEISHDMGGDWSLFGVARRGITKFASGQFETRAYALGLERRHLFSDSDRLSLVLSQPLRVESGGLLVSVPKLYDYQLRTATFTNGTLSLEPLGREVIGELGYQRKLRRGILGLNVYVRNEPGHFEALKPDVGGAVQLRLKF